MNESGTTQNGAIVHVETYTTGCVYDDCYVVDDGHDQLMLGFELDPAHGGIVMVTRDCAEKLARLIRHVGP